MDVARVVARVREVRPLVHCITAAVSMNTVADALLAAGAAPMMTETAQEAPVIVRRAEALLINLGTLSADGAAGIPPTVAAARQAGIAWVLDPAAVGLPPVRTALAGALLEQGPAVVRGNASEVLVLAGLGSGGRGPDSSDCPELAAEAARRVARLTGGVVAVSGAVDLITDCARTVRCANGTPLLTRVTGTGCALGALVAACCAVTDWWSAAVAATTWLGVAGEVAAGRARGPGSFRVELLDALASVGGAHFAGSGIL